MPLDKNQFAYEKAALLIAEGQLRYVQIAEQLNIEADTIRSWRKEPEFQQIVAKHTAELVEEARSFGIGQKHYRMKQLQDRHRLLQQIIKERALSDQMQNVPGGTTGLIVHDAKLLGSGKYAERVDLYEVDTGMLAEIRAHEQQAAKESGDWVDKTETKNETTVTVGTSVAEWLKATPEDMPTAGNSE